MTTQLNDTLHKANFAAKLFIIWNVIFFLISLMLKSSIASDAVDSVLLRGGVYAIGGFILVFLLRQMSQVKRSGWLRLSIITVLAPLGVIAFIAFTPHLPLWFDAGQIGSALILAYIAVLILKQDVRSQFPRANKSASK